MEEERKIVNFYVLVKFLVSGASTLDILGCQEINENYQLRVK